MTNENDDAPSPHLKELSINSSSVANAPMKPNQSSDSVQPMFEFIVDCQTEKQGIGMGVLTDGTPFLNQRGLARLCGVENAHIGTISSQWDDDPAKPRIALIKGLLAKRGIETSTAHVKVTEQNGKKYFAYPADICLAVLEYYAFEAGNNERPEARNNYRLLAGTALKDFIYTQVGYDPDNNLPERWKVFHDRVTLNSDVPNGYFSVFKEIADLIVTLGRHGVHIDASFVPDISVGRLWSRYWTDQNLEQAFGERKQYDHNYPEYFPQAASNPQPSYCYPEQALGAFRKWVREAYIGDGALKNYLQNQSRSGNLPHSFTQLALKAIESSVK